MLNLINVDQNLEERTQTVAVIREFFGIRYRHAEFGTRPDLAHPDMVAHPLSDGQYVVVECESMRTAYIAAHAAMGTVIEEGPLKGYSTAGDGVQVFRAAEHAPVTVVDEDAILGMGRTVTMMITAMGEIPALPHFASCILSRYDQVNGWVVPETIKI